MRAVTGAIEVLSFVELIGVIVLFVVAYAAMPRSVSVVLNGGEEIAYSGKFMLLLIFWVGFLAYGLLFLLKRFPHLMGYPVKITPQNMDYQARLAKLMLSVMTLICMLIIWLVLYELFIKNVKAVPMSDLSIILPLLVALILNIVIYLLIARKHK